MLNFSKERVLEIVRAKSLDVRELVSNPVVREKAYKMLYKSIPLPWRWFVGKKRVKRFVDMVIDMRKNKVVSEK